jgi:hypothetical protein
MVWDVRSLTDEQYEQLKDAYGKDAGTTVLEGNAIPSLILLKVDEEVEVGPEDDKKTITHQIAISSSNMTVKVKETTGGK